MKDANPDNVNPLYPLTGKQAFLPEIPLESVHEPESDNPSPSAGLKKAVSEKPDKELENIIHLIGDGWLTEAFDLEDSDMLLDLIERCEADIRKELIAWRDKAVREARIDETKKYLQLAKLAKAELAAKGLPLEIPVDTQIKICEDRLTQLQKEEV